MMNKLEFELEQCVMKNAKEIKKQCGHLPTRFLQMMFTYGITDTAKILLTDTKESEGLARLYLYNLEHLSLEAILTDSKWEELLGKDMIELARKRIKREYTV